jgi:hypothetical protein
VFLELVVIYFAVDEVAHLAQVWQVVFVFDVEEFGEDFTPNGFVEVSGGGRREGWKG